jgi:hypothetical protein
MARFQFDKKQLIPAVGMGVASAGLFTYFVLKMTTPPPLQAAPDSPQATAQVASAHGSTSGPNATAGAAGTQSDPLAAIDPLIGPPTASMRDPFAPQIIDPGPGLPKPVQVATNNLSPGRLPQIPNGLPPVGGSVQPIGLPNNLSGGSPGLNGSSAPQWTVTGVLSESSEPHNRVAIFRSGDARRFVRLGDMVDGNYRLIDVNRTGVVIADGSHHIHLPLGGYKKTISTHTPIQNGAATGPWTGTPASSGGTAQPGASQTSPAANAPASGQGAPLLAPAQTPANVPGPEDAAPTAGVL